jgi:hypothetical protein
MCVGNAITANDVVDGVVMQHWRAAVLLAGAHPTCSLDALVGFIEAEGLADVHKVAPVITVRFSLCLLLSLLDLRSDNLCG